jgi:hypothetical protein
MTSMAEKVAQAEELALQLSLERSCRPNAQEVSTARQSVDDLCKSTRDQKLLLKLETVRAELCAIAQENAKTNTGTAELL